MIFEVPSSPKHCVIAWFYISVILWNKGSKTIFYCLIMTVYSGTVLKLCLFTARNPGHVCVKQSLFLWNKGLDETSSLKHLLLCFLLVTSQPFTLQHWHWGNAAIAEILIFWEFWKMFFWSWNNNEVLLACKTQPVVGKPLMQKSATSVLLSWFGYIYCFTSKELSESLLTDMHSRFNIQITELCSVLQGYKGKMKASQNEWEHFWPTDWKYCLS